MSAKNHYVIIMAGGVGSRFWPMSRTAFPKQFHDILGRGRTLIQETFDRFAGTIPTENIYVVTNALYSDLVQHQLPLLTQDQILLEPSARNTAPCVAYAAYKIRKQNPNAVFIVAPADHIIADTQTFIEKINLGLEVATAQEAVVTLGITPSRPDTGYGYIQFANNNEGEYFPVRNFTEKPTLDVAKEFVASGDFVWNGGIFIFSARTICNAFSALLPDMAEQFSSIEAAYYTDEEPAAIAAVYATCRSISIDYGIMEKNKLTYVIPADFGWSDLGTWTSVHENSQKDDTNSAYQGKILSYKSSDNMVRISDPEKIVVINGLEGYIVVDMGDILMIGRKDDEQFVKQITADVKEQFGKDFV